MTVLEILRKGLGRIEEQLSERVHEAGDAVERELANSQQDVMSFLDKPKSHAISTRADLRVMGRHIDQKLCL